MPGKRQYPVLVGDPTLGTIESTKDPPVPNDIIYPIPLPSLQISVTDPEDPLILLVELSLNPPVTTHALIDSGASGSFINTSFIEKHSIPLILKDTPRDLTVVDGHEISSGKVTHNTPILLLTIGGHTESVTFDVTQLGNYPIILGLSWLKKHCPTIDWSEHLVTFKSTFCISNCLSQVLSVKAVPNNFNNLFYSSNKLSSQYYINNVKQLTDITLPTEYNDFAHIFSEVASEKLPPHRPYDHSIPLLPDTTPPFGPIYSLSELELGALKEYIDSNLAKGYIKPSTSPAGAPILFVKKKDGSLRLCVDYRGLNNITVRNRYPLPLINELLDRLNKAKIFTKIDLRGAYNLVRIAPGEEWKTAFRTRYGHFEYSVMPFGLCNAPASFQHLINDALSGYLDQFTIAYLDDILIFSSCYEDHVTHVRKVLECLQDYELFAKLEKCQFYTDSINFLGYTVSTKGITMDTSKVQSVLSWPTPNNPKEIQIFLGLANFYRWFINNFSKIVTPLT